MGWAGPLFSSSGIHVYLGRPRNARETGSAHCDSFNGGMIGGDRHPALRLSSTGTLADRRTPYWHRSGTVVRRLVERRVGGRQRNGTACGLSMVDSPSICCSRFGDEVVGELVDWLNSADADYRTALREQNEANFVRFDAKLEQRLSDQGAEFERRLAAIEQRVAAIEQRLAGFE